MKAEVQIQKENVRKRTGDSGNGMPVVAGGRKRLPSLKWFSGFTCCLLALGWLLAGCYSKLPKPPPPSGVAEVPMSAMVAAQATGSSYTSGREKESQEMATAARATEEKRNRMKSAQRPSISKEPTAHINQLMEAEKVQLKPASLAWNTPPKMAAMQAANVELKISRDVNGTLALTSQIQSSGSTNTATARLADEVTASLTSEGFSISPADTPTKILLPEGDRTWIWSIKPKPTSRGTQTLVLTVTSDLGLGGDSKDSRSRSFVRDIYVEVDDSRPNVMLDFFVKNWDKLWTLLLLPAGALVFQQIKRRRAGSAESPLPPVK